MEEIKGYQLIRKIGEGGMGTVYKGIQTSLNRPVAIKILSKKLVKEPEIIERFKRESLVIARLNNPNVIHVIDRGISPHDMPYFVMEYVEGTDLSVLIKNDSLDFNRKLDIVIQVCKALAYAHKNGVIHRDIKPGNVLIDGEGNARVLDFGIAQFYSEEDEGEHNTRSGAFMGTLPYMSPEQQVSAGNVSALSDLYSLGVLMYEIFMGIKPLGRFKLPSEIDPEFPGPLEGLIMSCMNQDPGNRPSTADDIKDRLLKLLRGAHLETTQRERAGRGILKLEDKFALLDVIKDKPCGSVYLYEEKIGQKLLVIKKKPSTSTGFMEAKLLTSLKHKNIADILGVSRNEQLFIIVMEYLSGGSLNDRLAKPYLLIEFLKTAREICRGLSFAHKNRITHGNLRPNNILFSDTGQVKIADFGLSEHYHESDENSNWYSVKGEHRSKSIDIYAAGVIFCQMLTGTMPVGTDVQSIQDRNFKLLPFGLQEMVSQMISRKKEERQSNFDQIITDIDILLADNMDKSDIDVDKTELLGMSKDYSSSGPVSISKRPMHYIVLFFIIIFISALTAIFFIHPDKLMALIGDFLDMWKLFLEQIEFFSKETLQPGLERLIEIIKGIF